MIIKIYTQKNDNANFFCMNNVQNDILYIYTFV